MKVAVSLRSSTMHYIHISEYGKLCSKFPDKAKEIRSGALNAGPKCVVVIESTAEGNVGDYYDKCMEAYQMQLSGRPLTRLDYKFFFFPWYDHESYVLDIPEGEKVPEYIREYFAEKSEEIGYDFSDEQMFWYYKKSLEQKDEMKREFPTTIEEAFAQNDKGSYYHIGMNKAASEKRICDLPYDPRYPVHTSWDIGHADATSIWHFQMILGYFHFIDYTETSGRTLKYFANLLRKKNYEYGRHIAPHDILVTEWGGGKSRIETALVEHGIRFEPAPKLPIDEGIEQVRNILPKCIFDFHR